LLVSTAAYAQITPSADAYTDTATATPTKNYGATTTLFVDGATDVSYIQFNLASIPAGASFSQATLKLYVSTVTTAGAFTLTTRLPPALRSANFIMEHRVSPSTTAS
jgi:hypothetical protein